MHKAIQNIWAVGRNYADHAKELGQEVPKEPLIFLKAGSCAHWEAPIPLPLHSEDVHFELELALCFNSRLEFDAAGLALDLTARDVQQKLKAQGQPWTLAKSFKASCPLSNFIDLPQQLPHFHLELRVNQQLRQQGHTSQLIFDFEILRQFVLAHFPVQEGDLLLTGTPAGVGPLKAGDQLQAIARSELGHEIEKHWHIVSGN